MIPINDLSYLLNRQKSLIENAISRVLNRGWLILGPELVEFESNFASFCGTEHCVCVANGTDALEIALRSTGINANKTVATVANAGAYASTAIQAIGARAYYLEVDSLSRCVSLRSIEKALTYGVDAIIITHLFGLVVPQIQEISALCKEHGTILIEDCAQAHGASINKQSVGSFGDAGTFSFYPTKNLGALGDGGAIVTNNQALKTNMLQFRQYGWSEKYIITKVGGRNSRLDELQAAILNNILPHLKENNFKRIEVAQYYSQHIKNSHVSLPMFPQHSLDVPYVAHLYVVECSARDKFRAHLKADGILTDVHYPIPDHLQSIKFTQDTKFDLAITERLARECVTLPLFLGITKSQQDQIIASVNEFHL